MLYLLPTWEWEAGKDAHSLRQYIFYFYVYDFKYSILLNVNKL